MYLVGQGQFVSGGKVVRKGPEHSEKGGTRQTADLVWLGREKEKGRREEKRKEEGRAREEDRNEILAPLIVNC